MLRSWEIRPGGRNDTAIVRETRCLQTSMARFVIIRFLRRNVNNFLQGLHDLRIWRNQVADGHLPSKTPAKVKDSGNEVMESLSKLTKRHHTGRIPQSDWLDRLTFREIELINEREKRTSNYMYLMVEFPRLEYHGVEVAFIETTRQWRVKLSRIFPSSSTRWSITKKAATTWSPD